MAVNKVDLSNGETLLDLTADTVEPETLAEGVTAHNSKGEQIVGTMTGGDAELVKALAEGGATEIILPDYVTKIKPNAFRYDHTIESITAPEVTEIHYKEVTEEVDGEIYIVEEFAHSFSECWNLRTFNMPKLEIIGCFAFELCTTLNLDYLPSGVKKIYLSAFASCWLLALKELPENLEYIGEAAFSSCESLALEKLPENLEYIGEAAFSYCPSLKISEIPASVKHIGSSAFDECPLLTNITFKGKPDIIDAFAFGFMYIDEDTGEIFTTSNISTINVPWAEGEVEGAPWGTNATINYNYTGG